MTPSLFLLGLLALWPVPCTAQAGRVKTVPVSKNVYMIMYLGGNIGLSVGDDGAFMVDDQYARNYERIQAAVAKVSKNSVKFLINTHWHGDHVGGNEEFAKTGALIFAHENVRKRMSVDQFMKLRNRTIPASPKKALPVVTFTDTATFHWNGDEIAAFHVKQAHTDGDLVIHFKKANVIHMGDTFFNERYPYIDLGSGGSLDGMIAAADRVLKLADEGTKIIPGHGVLSDRAGLETFRKMLITSRANVAKLVGAGRNLDEVIKAAPTKEYDKTWGRHFIKAEPWVRCVHACVTKK